jgi:hypothetical protein
MPTADQVAKWSNDFEESYPEPLSDRLRWFHQKLGIDEERLLRLVGLPDAEVKELEKGGSVDWKWVTNKHPDGAAWAEEILLQAVAFFNYNWEGLRYCIHPTRKNSLLKAPPKGEQDTMLLGVIAQGDERSTPALIAFLAAAPTP